MNYQDYITIDPGNRGGKPCVRGLRITVWEYAKNNDLMIVAKDSDMHQRSFVFGHPPKVVWVRLGNCSTSDVERLLRGRFAAIKAFYEDDYASFLSLS